MDKVELIKIAIEKAERLESKLTPEVINVPFLGSLKIRALLNNLGAISHTYLEIGCHKGGSFCSATYENPLDFSIAIDNWESDMSNEDKAYPQFRENVKKYKHYLTYLSEITQDCFSVKFDTFPWTLLGNKEMSTIPKVDFYNYDAGHSFEDQKMALTYYKPVLADEFIFVCDDWQYGEVKEGTLAGIEEGGYEVLFKQELLNEEPYNEEEHRNMEWWRGYAVFLLKKK